MGWGSRDVPLKALWFPHLGELAGAETTSTWYGAECSGVQPFSKESRLHEGLSDRVVWVYRGQGPNVYATWHFRCTRFSVDCSKQFGIPGAEAPA